MTITIFVGETGQIRMREDKHYCPKCGLAYIKEENAEKCCSGGKDDEV